MIETTTVLTKDIHKSLTRKIYVGSWIATTIGAIGILLYIFSDLIFGEVAWTNYLWLFSLPFGFGIVYLITLTKLYKKPIDEQNVNIYQFDNEGINVVTFKNGQNLGMVRVFYNQIEKIKDTNKYLFLYVNKYSAFPVLKKELSQSEIETIKQFVINK